MSIIWQNKGLNHGARPWTQEEIQLALKLAAEGVSQREIGLQVGRSASSVSVKLYFVRMDAAAIETYRRRRSARRKVGNPVVEKSIQVVNRPTPEMIRDRDVRAMLPHRDLTAAMFGDPKIGLSALEGRR